MKTKLELYQGVQALAVETLNKKSPEAEKAIEGLLTPLNLIPEERNRFSQLFFSRRTAMQDLKDQPLEVAATPPSPAAPKK